MKAVILAAGFGKRMGELTKYLPKPLIPVTNKPIIQHLIESLCESGIEDYLIVVGYQKDQIKLFLEKYQATGIKLKVVEAENFQKGPIHSFAACLTEINKEEFILIPGDFIVEPSVISHFLTESKSFNFVLAFDNRKKTSHQITILLSGNQKKRYVTEFPSNRIGEKSERSFLVPMLICRINFEPYIQKSIALNYTKVMDAVKLFLEEKNELNAVEIKDGSWFDLDTIQDVLAANKFLLNHLERNYSCADNLDYFNSRKIKLIKPLMIGKNCHFEDNCLIGPYVTIGENCFIGKGALIRNSIVCPNSKIPPNIILNNAIFFKSIFSINR